MWQLKEGPTHLRLEYAQVTHMSCHTCCLTRVIWGCRLLIQSVHRRFGLISHAGAVLIIIIVFMAVTSSGASEMVAISSLFTFDVYRRYIDPKVRPSHTLHTHQQGTLRVVGCCRACFRAAICLTHDISGLRVLM